MPFRTIAGHRRIVSLLSRAVAGDTLPPSLLLSGPPGIGKRRVAQAIAETLNCVDARSGGEIERDACGECASCRRIARGVHPDVVVVEPGESGSIKIAQVRDVVAQAGFRPFEGRRRVVVIDHADAMVDDAQNALLKTLEEPPSASVFLLVSSAADTLLPTVQSRCPRLRFGPLSAGDVADVLMREHGYAEADARAAAADADGSVGGALAAQSADLAEARDTARQLLEQAARVADPARRMDLAKTLAPARGTSGGEREQLAACLRATASLLRDLGILAVEGDSALIANADLATQLSSLKRTYGGERTTRAYAAVDKALAALERNASPKVVADWLVLEL